MSAIPVPFLRKQLEKVANSRPSSYVKKIAILVHWQADDSRSMDDIKTMEAIMNVFGIESKVYTIPQNETLGGWNLVLELQKLLKELHDTGQSCLMVFSYTGHGLRKNDELEFSPSAGGSNQAPIPWSQIYPFLSDNALSKIDVLTILDCCYSGSAARGFSEKAFHIIAACGPNESTNARGYAISFTQRIFRAVHQLSSATHTTTTELFNEIQRSKPKFAPNAVFRTLSGTRPIKLLFSNPARLPSPSSTPRLTGNKNVLVKLTLKGDGYHALPLFREAILGLPDALSVEVSDAYETDQSFFVLLRMTWESLCCWSMVVDLEMVGVISGPSLVHRELVEIPIRGMNEDL